MENFFDKTEPIDLGLEAKFVVSENFLASLYLPGNPDRAGCPLNRSLVSPRHRVCGEVLSQWWGNRAVDNRRFGYKKFGSLEPAVAWLYEQLAVVRRAVTRQEAWTKRVKGWSPERLQAEYQYLQERLADIEEILKKK